MNNSQDTKNSQPESDYERGFVDGMQKQMQSSVDKAVNAMSQRKPLTEWQITEIYTKWESTKGKSWADLIRAIEAAHGIKE